MIHPPFNVSYDIMVIIVIVIMLSFLLFGGSAIYYAKFPFYFRVSSSFLTGDHLKYRSRIPFKLLI